MQVDLSLPCLNMLYGIFSHGAKLIITQSVKFQLLFFYRVMRVLTAVGTSYVFSNKVDTFHNK